MLGENPAFVGKTTGLCRATVEDVPEVTINLRICFFVRKAHGACQQDRKDVDQNRDKHLHVFSKPWKKSQKIHKQSIFPLVVRYLHLGRGLGPRFLLSRETMNPKGETAQQP